MPFVKPKATPWTHDFMRDLMLELAPNPTAARILHAKVVLECSRDKKKREIEGISCWNHNVGNVRCFSDAMDYTCLRGAWEEKPDGTVYVPENNKFRAYSSYHEGVDGMLHVLSTQKNFAEAWDVLRNSPDPAAYVDAAKKGGYFTGNLDKYKSAIVSIFKEFS